MAEAMTTLGDLLRAATLETGLGLGDLTVLSPQNDPFRIARPAPAAGRGGDRDLKERLADLSLATEYLSIDWPAVETPIPFCSGSGPHLVTSAMPLTEAIRILRARKRYENGTD